MTLLSIKSLSIQPSPGVRIDSPDFTVGSAETVSLVGRNGSGKTTILTGIIGLNRLETGEILRKVNCLCIDHPLVPINKSLKVFDYLNSIRRLENVKIETLSNLLHDSGLETIRSRRIARLSTGQMKKVHLVAALMSLRNEPTLVVLDEPTNGLDSGSLNWLRRVFAELTDAGNAIVFASHDDEFIDKVKARRVHIGSSMFPEEGDE